MTRATKTSAPLPEPQKSSKRDATNIGSSASKHSNAPWDWERLFYGCAGILLLAVAAYWPAWHAGFVWDDDSMLTDNPAIKSSRGLYYIWCTTALPDYFP